MNFKKIPTLDRIEWQPLSIDSSLTTRAWHSEPIINFLNPDQGGLELYDIDSLKYYCLTSGFGFEPTDFDGYRINQNTWNHDFSLNGNFHRDAFEGMRFVLIFATLAGTLLTRANNIEKTPPVNDISGRIDNLRYPPTIIDQSKIVQAPINCLIIFDQMDSDFSKLLPEHILHAAPEPPRKKQGKMVRKFARILSSSISDKIILPGITN